LLVHPLKALDVLLWDHRPVVPVKLLLLWLWVSMLVDRLRALMV
jgi:hypothetical protein